MLGAKQVIGVEWKKDGLIAFKVSFKGAKPLLVGTFKMKFKNRFLLHESRKLKRFIGVNCPVVVSLSLPSIYCCTLSSSIELDHNQGPMWLPENSSEKIKDWHLSVSNKNNCEAFTIVSAMCKKEYGNILSKMNHLGLYPLALTLNSFALIFLIIQLKIQDDDLYALFLTNDRDYEIIGFRQSGLSFVERIPLPEDETKKEETLRQWLGQKKEKPQRIFHCCDFQEGSLLPMEELLPGDFFDSSSERQEFSFNDMVPLGAAFLAKEKGPFLLDLYEDHDRSRFMRKRDRSWGNRVLVFCTLVFVILGYWLYHDTQGLYRQYGEIRSHREAIHKRLMEEQKERKSFYYLSKMKKNRNLPIRLISCISSSFSKDMFIEKLDYKDHFFMIKGYAASLESYQKALKKLNHSFYFDSLRTDKMKLLDDGKVIFHIIGEVH